MKYYFVEPEVAGGFGDQTLLERKPGRPTIVHKLHYQFDGWLGDHLLESTPCFVVSERLAQEIQKANLTGATFSDVVVTQSQVFRDLHPNRTLPKFLWLRVTGEAEQDDFGIAVDCRLVVSESALDVLRRTGISHAAIQECAT